MKNLSESLSKCRVEGNILFLPPISEGPLKNYPQVKSALMKAGATYKKNTFIFNSDAQPFIDRLMSGEKVNIKKEYQFFETPDHLAQLMIEKAQINIFDKVLEPSAGRGAIVESVPALLSNVNGYELMAENQDILLNVTNFTLLGSNFLTDCDHTFDKIIANPPFSKNQDIDHINKMYDCLNPGGRIVTIASTHWQQSQNSKEEKFRTWLKAINATIEEIPEGTFKSSGTLVKSCLIVINKA